MTAILSPRQIACAAGLDRVSMPGGRTADHCPVEDGGTLQRQCLSRPRRRDKPFQEATMLVKVVAAPGLIAAGVVAGLAILAIVVQALS